VKAVLMVAAKDLRAGDWIWQAALSHQSMSGYRRVTSLRVIGDNIHVDLATGWSTAYHPRESVAIERDIRGDTVKVEHRETKWGRMFRLGEAEVMHFDKPGKFHAHQDQTEIVYCVAGMGDVVEQDGPDDEVRKPCTPGCVIEVGYAVPHRMEPDPLGPGLTCLITYQPKETT